MPTYRVHFKSKGGDQFMLIDAPNPQKAEQEAVRAQHRRHDRFPLTFERLNQSLEEGKPHPMLAANSKLAGLPPEHAQAYIDAEIELRKRDQSRYDDDDLKVAGVEKV